MNFENIRFEHQSVLYFYIRGHTLKSPIPSQVDTDWSEPTGHKIAYCVCNFVTTKSGHSNVYQLVTKWVILMSAPYKNLKKTDV